MLSDRGIVLWLSPINSRISNCYHFLVNIRKNRLKKNENKLHFRLAAGNTSFASRRRLKNERIKDINVKRAPMGHCICMDKPCLIKFSSFGTEFPN